jgi:hypothetical protein
MTPREMVVRESLSWFGTRFHHEARVKGAGVDCGTLIAEVFERAGLIPHQEIPHYPPDFMMHRNEEWYVELVQKYFNEIEPPPLPGDIVLIHHGRLFSHGLIVIKWPGVIHASAPDKRVVLANVKQTLMADKKMRFFRLKEWCHE